MFNIFKKVLLVTHSSRFHSDDVFAAAVLIELLKKRRVSKRRIKIIRTRDPKLHKKADFLFDVGGEYDPSKKHFDHHQKGYNEKRTNGVPYASFGLVWKEYGAEICNGNEKVSRIIDERLVQPIDALDNAFPVFDSKVEGFNPYLVQDVVSLFNPSWTEDFSKIDELFLKAVSFAYSVLEREIKKTTDRFTGEKYVREAYEQAKDKRLLILEGNYPYEMFVTSVPEPLIIVRPSPQDGTWKVEAVQEDYRSYSYKNRIQLPADWAGKRDGELVSVTGVPDAVFCHNGRFLAIAKSKEGALALAKKVIGI